VAPGLGGGAGVTPPDQRGPKTLFFFGAGNRLGLNTPPPTRFFTLMEKGAIPPGMAGGGGPRGGGKPTIVWEGARPFRGGMQGGGQPTCGFLPRTRITGPIVGDQGPRRPHPDGRACRWN